MTISPPFYLYEVFSRLIFVGEYLSAELTLFLLDDFFDDSVGISILLEDSRALNLRAPIVLP